MSIGTPSKSYLFGSLVLRREPGTLKRTVEVKRARLGIVAGLGLLMLYATGVAAGFLWLRQVRHAEMVTWPDVALLRWKSVRETLGRQQFARARAEWAEVNYQAAYLSFSGALRNAPGDKEGRLAATEFLNAMGMSSMSVNLLQDGLALTPADRRLTERALSLLTSTGRDQQALELIRGRLGRELTGPNAGLLRSYEVLATLNVNGALEAKRLLDEHREVQETPEGALVTARVLWELRDKLGAIKIVRKHLQKHPGEYGVYLQLATYEEAAGLMVDACDTAERACAKFPDDIAPYLLRLGVSAAGKGGQLPALEKEIAQYFTRFKKDPQALPLLAELAGRKGWVELSRGLYEIAVARRQNPRLLGLYYSDALARAQRLKEAQQVLAEIEAQSEEGGQFMLVLRQRQVVVAAGRGVTDDVREAARRLAGALQRDPEMRETYRRRFETLGIPVAAAEFTAASSGRKPAPSRGSGL